MTVMRQIEDLVVPARDVTARPVPTPATVGLETLAMSFPSPVSRRAEQEQPFDVLIARRIAVSFLYVHNLSDSLADSCDLLSR